MNPTSDGTDQEHESALLYRGTSLSQLADRALELAGAPGRTLIGIAGEPGSGKSTLAERLLTAIGQRRPHFATVVSMDGFHLAQRVVEERGHGARKGAIDTFDAEGFLAALQRVRRERAGTVWWPEFRRDLEEPVAGALEVAPRHQLVIVEGNFLLAAQPPWHRVKDLLTETWFLDAAPGARRERLARRYIHYGFTPQAAHAKTTGVDESTSALIRSSANRADLTLTEAR
ncbi:nucleoside/nucleotide kinase family protein [Streptomyces sp. NBC_00859]|uniref:nucleoside/nucleotide kinase family protein n=1 Tax=Streptomyces sp. NBC_00859 TaxID=2903682 RepID=UPI003866D123|nr:nucleoside/nucleotide kinase family protein [Streptomyces sp. NBC_00859]